MRNLLHLYGILSIFSFGCSNSGSMDFHLQDASFDDGASVLDARNNEPLFIVEMQKLTGENMFARLVYNCDECSFAQFAAIVPLPEWVKSPTQVILPAAELQSTPSFDGVPNSIDFVPEVPGNEYTLIAKALDGRVIEIGENGVMAVVQVQRDTVFRYPTGSRVHELTDPEGNTFILFAYQVESKDFESPHFEDSNALVDYPGPKDWTYTTRIVDEELMMSSNGVATVLAISRSTSSVWQQR